jgi:RNA polymerase sigma-70 factor (ECF subfamily)
MSMQKSCEFEGYTDELLVRWSQAGRRDAFSELIRRNYNHSLKLAISILHDREDAEDEAQNAYWKALQHIDQFLIDAKFSTWMTRIVVNQCLMRLRKVRRAKFLYIDDARIGEERGTMELHDVERSPESLLGAREVSTVLKREIRRIPPLLRSVFVLRDVDELPMPEVAEQLGITVAAAKSRLLRARAELKGRLEKHCGSMGAATLTGTIRTPGWVISRSSGNLLGW